MSLQEDCNVLTKILPKISISSCIVAIVGSIILIYIIYKLLRKTKNDYEELVFVYNNECPICFNTMIHPIKANCNHGYCLDCLYTYSQKRSWNKLCPLCRYPIQQLLLMETGNCKYLETTKKLLLEKMARITSKSGITIPKLSNILYYLLGTTLCIMWIWNLLNLKILYH